MPGVQVVTWVPQNDILAHPNLRAFLSHVGINSMYEVRAMACSCIYQYCQGLACSAAPAVKRVDQ